MPAYGSGVHAVVMALVVLVNLGVAGCVFADRSPRLGRDRRWVSVLVFGVLVNAAAFAYSQSAGLPVLTVSTAVSAALMALCLVSAAVDAVVSTRSPRPRAGS